MNDNEMLELMTLVHKDKPKPRTHRQRRRVKSLARRNIESLKRQAQEKKDAVT